MANNEQTSKYYPALSNIISISDLPDTFRFISDEINDLFSKIFYKDYQKFLSVDGSAAFYSLSIVSLKKLKVEIPGTNIFFVLNDDIDDNTISTFPVTVFWQWEIIKLVNSFDVTKFSFEPIELLKLALNLFNIKETQLLELVTNSLSFPSEQDISKFEQVVHDINNYLGIEIEVPVDVYTLDDSYPSHNDDNDIEADDNIIADDIRNKYTLSNDKFSQLKDEIDQIGEDITSIVFAIYISQTDLTQSLAKLNTLLSSLVPNDVLDYFRQLITPKARATLELTAAIEFPRNVLLPMIQGPNGFSPDNALDTSGNLKKSRIQFADARLDVDTSTGFGYQTDLDGTLIPQYAQIANTFLIISFSNVKLDLSQTTNIPEADAAGYPVDFVGAYVQEASITFNGFGTVSTAHESATLSVQNFLVGTGGITGTVSLASNGVLYRDFGNFAVELKIFSVTFRQNVITNSSISGTITLPDGFDDDGEPSIIKIDGSIRDNGDFKLTGTFLGELPVFRFPNVFEFTLNSAEVGEKGGRFYLTVSGTLDFIADIPILGDVLPKDIVIRKLIIWDNGDLEFEHGGLTVDKAFPLHVGPVKLEVSHLELGSYTRKHNGIDREYYYFGFDGMVNAGTAGLEARGDGIKYYFTHDDNKTDKPFDQFLSIDGIFIDISVPADDPAFILNGYLSMKNPDPNIVGSNAGVEYTGRISVALPKLRIMGSAAMRLNPSVPSFVVDLGLDLPISIPLGATGLGIYGIRGLIGQHYLPSKRATKPPLPDDATWWDYYKAKSSATGREGIEIDKFESRPGFSVGAGISIATEFFSGFIFSSKLFLLLGLPDVFLIQGQAAILRDRIGLQDDVDPPFSALIVFGDHSIQGALGVDFFLPGSGSAKGSILGIKAELEMAFFFNNASGWFLNIGKDSPKEAQVMAKPILDIFTGHAYLMISSHGIKAGAGISYDFNRKFGPVQVGFGAALDMGGFISFKPVQIGAFIQVSGYAYLKVWKFKFGLSIAIALAVEAPHPFNITGSLRVKLNLPWPIPDIKFKLDVSWHFNDDVDLTQVPVLGLPDPEAGYLPVAAVNILSNETFQVNYVTVEDLTDIPSPGDPAWKYNFTNPVDAANVVIPLDSFVDIGLLKPVMPGNTVIGGTSSQLADGYTELIPPVKGVKAQVKHQYELKDLGIFTWDGAGAAWVPYNVYEAVTAIVDSNTGDNAVDLSKLKAGYWQFVEKDKYNKIRLLSQNMFSYGNGTITDQLDMDGRGFRAGDVFCFDEVMKTSIVNWKNVAADTSYPDDSPVPVQALTFTFTGISASVKNEAGFNANSLFLDGGAGEVIIAFPESVANVKLEFGDNSNNVTINFIQPVFKPGDFGQTVFSEAVIGTSSLGSGQQNGVVTYDNAGQPISKIRLTFAKADVSAYTGDLILGGHLQLPAGDIPAGLNDGLEMDRSLLFSALYNRSFTSAEVLGLEHTGQPGIAAQWSMDGLTGDTGGLNGILAGSPGIADGFYKKDASSQELFHNVYRFTANDDAVIIPNAPEINLENESFAVEISAAFNPFAAGISTLLYKVAKNQQDGGLKGYAIHLVQATPAHAYTRYADSNSIPEFTILFTCYDGLASSAVSASEKYTINCAGSTVAEKQYKRIFVIINRETGKLELYIDRVLKTSVDIPAALGVSEAPVGSTSTYLNQVTYTTETLQARQADNPVTHTDFINEVAVLNDTINKTIQPVWRPDTTFAVTVKTFDRVNNTSTEHIKTHIFGFKTAGPLGHFHQYSKIYQDLAGQDQPNAFKLSNLKYYINYDRSFPDAQGRYELSKPVFYHNPQVKLYFDQPYLNAMYNNWDSYHGLPAAASKLELQLLDPAGNVLTRELVWAPVQEIPIDGTNYSTLTHDQQLIYLFNQAASHGGCNPMTDALVKKLTQGSYQFPDLLPGKLYTALFNAVYQPDGATSDSVEVHKFGFITSRYATFQEQAGSFVLDATPGAEKYVLHVQPVAFNGDYIEQTLKKLINTDVADDPETVMKYAVPYERLVYGGLKLAAPETLDTTAIQLVVNTNPADQSVKLLGILIYNPEPFNDPKLPAESVADTIKLTLELPDHSTLQPESFIRIYSRDNSAVFVTNPAMDIPSGHMQLSFKHKIFNGVDYETVFDTYDGPAIDLSPWF